MSKPCPICKKPAVAQYRPFCSRRCADVDLGRWFDGSYAVPIDDDEPLPTGAGETDETQH